MRYDELMETAVKKMKEQGIFERWSFYGTETGYTRVTNYEFFKTIVLKLRTIDATVADTRTFLFGQDLSTPIIAGAMSNPGIKEIPDALQCWAKGMKEAGSMMGVGITSADAFAEVMKIGAPTYRIAKPFKDRQKIVAEMKEAEKLGAVAVGTDIDFGLGNKVGHKPLYVGEMAPLSFAELTDLRKETHLPFIVKGILHEDDAEKAVKIGAEAIVLSNHRAMVLDYCVHSLEVLPRIREVVGKQMTVLVDGGFMLGSDVLKALAMGANGVLVGQAILYGAIANEANGVKDMIGEMTSQLQRAMTLTGCPDLNSVDESILHKRNYIL
jgi:isopentenyl diphosphate isomerase/L-lactate dehydrogenase-like FMN-dependent dehydrogenase